MSSTGKITFRFNKPIKTPPFALPDNALRRLDSADEPLDLGVSISIPGGDDDYDSNKSIANLVFVESTPLSLILQIVFADIADISPDITDPDELSIKFELPDLFVDEETGKALDAGSLDFKMPIQQ